jgi:hypothetical protein
VRLAGLLALSALAVYLASFRTIQGIDPNTNALLAYSFVRDRDAYLDEFAPDRERISYWSFIIDGRVLAPYPPGAALFASPFVAVGTAAGIVPPQAAAITVVAKSAAAVAAAASVAFVFLLAARTAGRRVGIVVAALYAFATVTWPISAGALWQHGPAQLFLATALFWLHPSSRDRWAARSGLAFGLATLCRLTDGAFAIAAAAYVALARRQVAARLLAWALVPAGALLTYNVAAFGDPFDLRYLVFNFTKDGGEKNVFVGVLGNLIAPNRGLFVYSPFLILAAYELVRRSLGRDRLALFVRSQLVAGVAILLVYAASVDWWGGYGYGNRYLADALPLLSFGLALWLRRSGRGRRARVFLAVAAVPAVAVFALGALVYDWQDWSWERMRDLPQSELQWFIDPPQVWYTAANASARVDALTVVSLVVVTAVLALYARLWMIAGVRRPARALAARSRRGTVTRT